MGRGKGHVDQTEGRPGQSLPAMSLSFSIRGMQCSPSSLQGIE